MSEFGCDDELHQLDRRITSAWAALSGARAAAWRSPNGKTCAIEDMAERTVNELLEKRHELSLAPASVDAQTPA